MGALVEALPVAVLGGGILLASISAVLLNALFNGTTRGEAETRGAAMASDGGH